MNRAEHVEKMKKAARKLRKHAKAAGFEYADVCYIAPDDDYSLRMQLSEHKDFDGQSVTLWL